MLLSFTFVDPGLVADLRRQEVLVRELLFVNLPDTNRAYVFHLLTTHMVDNICYAGPVRGWWCFRGERAVGDTAKSVASYRFPLKSLGNMIVTSSGYRDMAGISAQADAYLRAVAKKDPSKRKFVDKVLKARKAKHL